MSDIINNPWVVGIVGSIVSGLIVYFITYAIISKREDKIYQHKIIAANSEILHTIKSMVTNKQLLSVEAFNSVVTSTAKKHQVNLKDINNISEFIDDIIKDIIQSPFITYEQKNEYYEQLDTLKEEQQNNHPTSISEYKQIRQYTPNYIAVLLGITTILYMSVLLSVTLRYYEVGQDNVHIFLEELSIIPFMIIIIPVISLVITGVIIRIFKIFTIFYFDKTKQ